MEQKEILEYYSRPEIQKAIFEIAEGREVAPVLSDGKFGKRPGAVFYEKDVEQMIKQGAVSLHGSVERWRNPLSLKTGMRSEKMDSLRTGWDLIIDIDCYRSLDYAEEAALSLIDAFELFGISSYGIKFSGNRGFHLSIPFEAFPKKIMGVGDISKKYPDFPKEVINFLRDFTYDDMKKRFQEDPKKVLSLDSALITSRHLFRLPYCLHRKTWMASIPITKEQLENFDKETAKPENVKVTTTFLKTDAKENEAFNLLDRTLYYASKKPSPKTAKMGDMKLPARAIKEGFFPPCIRNILEGIKDGRKRSIFILITYLHHIGWKKEDVENLLLSWNEKNEPPLKKTLIKTTLNNQYSRSKPQMAPNCRHPGYYTAFGVCTPDEFCKKIHNPVTYTLSKVKDSRRHKKKKRKKKKSNKKKNKNKKDNKGKEI